MGAYVSLHVSVESNEAARRVVESNFSGVVQVNAVEEVTLQMCRDWSRQCPSCSLVIVGAGPPCQGVSRLNFDRRGAEEDPRSSLHLYVKPIVEMIREKFDWCQVHFLQESVASMDSADKVVYTRAADVIPYDICASQISPCRRDRLYWFDWTLDSEEGVKLYPPSSGDPRSHGRMEFEVEQTFVGCLEKGWSKHSDSACLATFTTAQPSSSPRSRPAGIHKSDDSCKMGC